MQKVHTVSLLFVFLDNTNFYIFSNWHQKSDLTMRPVVRYQINQCYLSHVAQSLSVQTHNAGVITSIPPCVAFKTPLVRKATGNHLMNSTSLERTQSAVSGFCYARNRVWSNCWRLSRLIPLPLPPPTRSNLGEECVWIPSRQAPTGCSPTDTCRNRNCAKRAMAEACAKLGAPTASWLEFKMKKKHWNPKVDFTSLRSNAYKAMSHSLLWM